ncbi:interferon regulatory factor 4-like [Alligator sinensis]|uniref:Interferon regulatory factor 4-like n=1 Tax=Alligator sinensis TaxID=38654 RepID=A0A1U7RWR8_ALLSI|nr:interferon regulatory factor 4-like [Alligator sinensis]
MTESCPFRQDEAETRTQCCQEPHGPVSHSTPASIGPPFGHGIAWAVYKGKYQEGTDKADPSTWKTRLRCALNKSTDFQEVPERSQLDISEPYKVYQIVSEGAREPEKAGRLESPALEKQRLSQPGTARHPLTVANHGLDKASASSDTEEESKKDGTETDQGSPVPPVSLLPSHPAEQGYRVKGVFYGWNPAHGHLLQSPPSCPSYVPVDNINNSDCWLHIRLYYCDVLVTEFTTHTAEGCVITYRPVPADNERLYGPSCMEQIPFPPPRLLSTHSGVASVLDVLERLLPHLDRGVLLWVAPEGVFMKRQCQGRVYWNGPLAPHHDRPNKLEREKTYKLLDTQQFLQQLRGYLSRGEPVPQYQIHLCFGEEFPASPGQNFQKLIMAHIEPVFARELFHCAQRMGPQLLQDSVPPSASDGSSHIIHILKQLCQP